MLVLCSRNARPQKGLVRRAHLNQHGRPSWCGKTSELGWIIWKDEGRSMRAVKARLATPYEEVVKRCQKRSNEEMVAGNALLSLPTLWHQRRRDRNGSCRRLILVTYSSDCTAQGHAITPVFHPFIWSI